MQPRLLSLLLGVATFTLVSAFSDTSPYFLISSISTYVVAPFTPGLPVR